MKLLIFACLFAISFAQTERRHLQSHQISGSINFYGLTESVPIQNTDNGDQLTLSPDDTSFALPSTVSVGNSYAVTIQTQPSGYTCEVSNGSGTVAGDVSDIVIDCLPDPALEDSSKLADETTCDGVEDDFYVDNGATRPECESAAVEKKTSHYAYNKVTDVCWVPKVSDATSICVTNAQSLANWRTYEMEWEDLDCVLGPAAGPDDCPIECGTVTQTIVQRVFGGGACSPGTYECQPREGNCTPRPSFHPTSNPSTNPSSAPTCMPSTHPTNFPSTNPTVNPTTNPFCTQRAAQAQTPLTCLLRAPPRVQQ